MAVLLLTTPKEFTFCHRFGDYLGTDRMFVVYLGTEKMFVHVSRRGGSVLLEQGFGKEDGLDEGMDGWMDKGMVCMFCDKVIENKKLFENKKLSDNLGKNSSQKGGVGSIYKAVITVHGCPWLSMAVITAITV